MANKKEYTNEDIVSLKGEDRVRKSPAVIFGSDGLEGCKHSVFEILSHSITGSLFTASFMQVASIIITAEITMNIRWVLTD